MLLCIRPCISHNGDYDDTDDADDDNVDAAGDA